VESPKLANDRAALFRSAVLTSPFKSKVRLEAENGASTAVDGSRRRLHVASGHEQRSLVLRPAVSWFHHPTVLTIIRPRRSCVASAAFLLLRWKSRDEEAPANRSGLARADPGMSVENPLWGRHAFTRIAQARLCRRSIKRRQIHGEAARAPSQGWHTFLHNHAQYCCDGLFVVPTIASTCFMPSSSCGSIAEASSGTTSRQPTAEWIARS